MKMGVFILTRHNTAIHTAIRMGVFTFTGRMTRQYKWESLPSQVAWHSNKDGSLYLHRSEGTIYRHSSQGLTFARHFTTVGVFYLESPYDTEVKLNRDKSYDTEVKLYVDRLHDKTVNLYLERSDDKTSVSYTHLTLPTKIGV